MESNYILHQVKALIEMLQNFENILVMFTLIYSLVLIIKTLVNIKLHYFLFGIWICLYSVVSLILMNSNRETNNLFELITLKLCTVNCVLYIVLIRLIIKKINLELI